MAVSMLVSLLPYWNYVNIEISPVLDKIYIWNIFEKFLGYFWTTSKLYCISCMSVSLLYLFQLEISGGQLLRPLVLFIHSLLFHDFAKYHLHHWTYIGFIFSVTHLSRFLPYWLHVRGFPLPSLSRVGLRLVQLYPIPHPIGVQNISVHSFLKIRAGNILVRPIGFSRLWY